MLPLLHPANAPPTLCTAGSVTSPRAPSCRFGVYFTFLILRRVSTLHICSRAHNDGRACVPPSGSARLGSARDGRARGEREERGPKTPAVLFLCFFLFFLRASSPEHSRGSAAEAVAMLTVGVPCRCIHWGDWSTATGKKKQISASGCMIYLSIWATGDIRAHSHIRTKRTPLYTLALRAAGCVGRTETVRRPLRVASPAARSEIMAPAVGVGCHPARCGETPSLGVSRRALLRRRELRALTPSTPSAVSSCSKGGRRALA